MAWDVTVPDTYAESHIGSTATKPEAAAQKTAQNKIDKYSKLASTHIFYQFAIEIAGTCTEGIYYYYTITWKIAAKERCVYVLSLFQNLFLSAFVKFGY